MATNSTSEDAEFASKLFFDWLDVTLFSLMLGLSTMIGIYFGYCGKKEDTPKEYLHGGKTMSTFPVSMSLVSSALSGITVLGMPSEVYRYGTLYWLLGIPEICVCTLNYFFYLPMFYELQLTSTYEYLKLRFSRHAQIMASFLYAINMILYIPIVVYGPALVLSQVSGVNLHIITVGTSVVCIFYTMLGGMKAVVWTDFLQGILMIASGLVVIVIGVIHVGGVDVVWQRNWDDERIRIFDMTLSPFVRLSFWAVCIGNTFNWLYGIGVNQAMVQKFMSLPTYSKANRSLLILCVGVIGIKTISCVTGLIIYSTYYDCDPMTTKTITKPDELLTYYVMDVASYIPGLPGLFLSGVFSAALSTMSSSLNALGATMYEDFIRPFLKKDVSGATANNIIKGIVIVIGGICVLLVFVVDKLGSILQLSLSLSGAASGAMLGLFSFGMFYPRGNTKGVLAGSICSLIIMSWIVFGTQTAIADGSLRHPVLPTSVEGCPFNVTLPEPTVPSHSEEEVLLIYRVSFLYYTPIGTIIVFIVGFIVSIFTEPPRPEQVRPCYFTPIVRKYLMKNEASSKDKPVNQKLLMSDQ